jgi:hypothetical protein
MLSFKSGNYEGETTRMRRRCISLVEYYLKEFMRAIGTLRVLSWVGSRSIWAKASAPTIRVPG